MPLHPYTTSKTPPTTAAPAKPERAHARVRIPGHVEFGGQRYRLYDLSQGGFCFESHGASLQPGDTQRGTVVLNADGMAVTLSAVAFEVVHHDAQTRRTCCEFQNLGSAEATALRNIITARLAGDPITAADVSAVSGPAAPSAPSPGPRPAVSARPMRPPPQARSGGRFRALLTTALFLGAAVVAFGYTARQINRVVFASTATAAKVAGPTYSVVMPREGTFYSLVPEDGIVKKGAPIASFEAPVLDLVRNQTLGANMTAEQLQKLMKVTVKGTITSPCDCKVQTQHVADGQYVAKEQALFELMPRDFTPYLIARFRNDQLEDIAQGDRVMFRVAGDPHQRVGTITQVRAHGRPDTVETDIMVMIEPQEALPAEMLSRPAEVVAGGFGLPDAITGLTATAKESNNP